MEKPKEVSTEPGKSRQYITAVIANLAALAYGSSLGWVSPVLPALLSDETPVGTEPMTDESASWLVAILCLGGLVTTAILGPLSEKFGRKEIGCLVTVPSIISWLLKIFAPDQNYLIAARFLAGVNGAGCIFFIPLYISETTSDAIRGTAGSFLVLFLNIGFLFSFIVGPLIPFNLFATVCLILPLIFLGFFAFMPETPAYLIRKNKIAEATKALTWLKGGNKEAIDQELVHLQSQIKEESVSKSSKFSDLFKDRGTIKGLIIAFGLLGGQQMCGMLAVLSYSTRIFEMAGSTLSPYIATITIGVIQLLGSYLSTVLIDRAGRKLLILISCALMSACHVILGIFCYFHSLEYDMKAIGWIPVTALSIFVLVHCLGLGPVPFIVVSEIFRPELASLASGVSLCLMWFLLFIVVKFFATAIALIGIASCFLILAGFCACTFLLTLLIVPETKGRTIESIYSELNGIPSLNFSGKV